MPRRESFISDLGDDGIGPPERFSFQATASHNNAFLQDAVGTRPEDDPELMELERRLNEEVDEDFFEEPRKFNTLQRVIDVLGLQMMDDATFQSTAELSKNPAYRQLRGQQQIVEGAIEHMAVIHCADLNGSVIQVGRVARQFSEAVGRVRTLRKQVRDIQDTLGASTSAAPEAKASSRPQNAAAMSLRELWLKKLECEATLCLLEKLDVIRAAPAKFDMLLRPPMRIGAAVLTLSEALSIMFSDDVAQVQALHKIMEQLMLRKQRAEEIVWETLHDVVYLRTANGLAEDEREKARDTPSAAKNALSSGHSVGSESRRSTNRVTFRSSVSSAPMNAAGMVNPFFGGPSRRFAVDEDLDDQSVDSTTSGASLFSREDSDAGGVAAAAVKPAPSSSASDSGSVGPIAKRLMIPIPIVEAELDLEEDERRCLEEIALSTMGQQPPKGSRGRQLPRYADPILALRILVECLAQLKRLDDVERIMGEGLEREIRRIVQREQSRTFARLEKKRLPQTIRGLGRSEDLTDFRRHLTGLLSAFGCVMVRLSHLTEILRLRIGADRELLHKIESPSSVMRSVLSSAYDIVQRELKVFLKACLNELEPNKNDPMDTSTSKGSTAYERGLFSLGIVEDQLKPGQQVSTANRSNVMDMSTKKFVTNVLFPKTKSEPQVRHALTFRRSIAKWTADNEALKKELAQLTGEDTSAPSFQFSPEETAISYLDTLIQKELLPVLQEEAVNGTVKGLERRDAFDPVLDRTLYARPNSNEPQDVDMCMACQAMYDSTSPLFLALHRLPRGGEMYLPMVAVLEHVMLTFISRVKQQIDKICNKKSAFSLVGEDEASEELSAILERRRPFTLLMRAYADGDSMEASPLADDVAKQTGLLPLAPPAADTAPRRQVGDLKADTPIEEMLDGVDSEESILALELKYLGKYLGFLNSDPVVVCTDEEIMKASCLAHSLLKLASLLESRLKVRGGTGLNKTLVSTRTLQESIKTIKRSGVKLAKFCRLDMLLQTSTRLALVASSSTLVARDAVRIPSSVNDLGEYLTGASDNLREAAGNAVTAYTFSSLEQYIPFCLMETVRIIAAGKGIVAKSPLTMNGIEALDRSGSVLYRDLKGATSFDNSFWDVELAAVSFERSASFMAMMELEMEELVAYYTANQEDFSEEDFMLMFAMTGPRRRGDIGQYHMVKRRQQQKK